MRTFLTFLVLTLIAASCFLSAANRLPALDAERWVNTPPLTTQALRGKIVLIDVWEYTCINWIRTAPYVKAWHRDYASLGLVVVGVHAPEFEFGKRAQHVDRGIREHGLTYPIAIDNRFNIWRALRNNAWPAKYLFDEQGNLVGSWVGEGRYGEIETAIRGLIKSADPKARLPEFSAEATAFMKSGEPSYAGITAETYLGAERRERRAFTLEGDWTTHAQFAELGKGVGKIVIPFRAGEVNLVMQPGASGHAAVTVLLDGQPVGDFRGADVGTDGVVRLERSGMVRLVNNAPRGNHILTLVSADAGLRAYAFTFGP